MRRQPVDDEEERLGAEGDGKEKQERALRDLDTKLQELEALATTDISRTIEQLRQLRTRITERHVMGTQFLTVSRIRMLEAIEDQLRILQDESSTPLDIERAELRAHLLMRIAGEQE